MIRVGALLIVLMITPAKAGKVDITYCAQAPDVTAARLKSAFARAQNSKLQNDDSCRVYRGEFYEAAVTRQNVTQCEQDDIRQHALQAIDAEINAFNDLIATYCGE
jgi:3-deoxy-D-arabino-heptulosonate 7-phosphate (DAHP) synthase class II